MKPILWIVIPCYNEEEVLPVTAGLFKDELRLLMEKGKVSGESRVLFVNDGSRDATWDLILKLASENEEFEGVTLSRNRGHQNAVYAGLMEAKERADIAISIDCDGQDDISAMEAMVDAYAEGCDIVYGVRSARKDDTFFKRTSAHAFYGLMNKMGAEVVYDHADYRLVSKRVLEAFSDYREVNLFLRGMFPLIGFKSTSVYYERHERMAGKSHYPLSKMFHLAVDGITSLSVKPLHIISFLGALTALFGLGCIVWVVVRWMMGATVAGWPSTLCAICLLGGIQLLSIGVLGEYVGKIYMETKQRPRYCLSERTYAEGGKVDGGRVLSSRPKDDSENAGSED